MNNKPLPSQPAPSDNLIWFWEEITAVPDDILPELLTPSLDDLWDNTNSDALMAYLDEFLQQFDNPSLEIRD